MKETFFNIKINEKKGISLVQQQMKQIKRKLKSFKYFLLILNQNYLYKYLSYHFIIKVEIKEKTNFASSKLISKLNFYIVVVVVGVGVGSFTVSIISEFMEI